MARWYPEADDGAWIDVPVFAEKGKPPQVPGPLVRIPTGTTVELTLENRLDSAITVHGLLTRPAATLDSTAIAAHERHTFRFAAGAPGTYLYWAQLGPDDRGTTSASSSPAPSSSTPQGRWRTTACSSSTSGARRRIPSTIATRSPSTARRGPTANG